MFRNVIMKFCLLIGVAFVLMPSKVYAENVATDAAIQIHEHSFSTVVTDSAIAATIFTDGKEVDIKCDGCDEIVTGAAIQAHGDAEFVVSMTTSNYDATKSWFENKDSFEPIDSVVDYGICQISLKNQIMVLLEWPALVPEDQRNTDADKHIYFIPYKLDFVDGIYTLYMAYHPLEIIVPEPEPEIIIPEPEPEPEIITPPAESIVPSGELIIIPPIEEEIIVEEPIQEEEELEQEEVIEEPAVEEEETIEEEEIIIEDEVDDTPLGEIVIEEEEEDIEIIEEEPIVEETIEEEPTIEEETLPQTGANNIIYYIVSMLLCECALIIKKFK